MTNIFDEVPAAVRRSLDGVKGTMCSNEAFSSLGEDATGRCGSRKKSRKGVPRCPRHSPPWRMIVKVSLSVEILVTVCLSDIVRVNYEHLKDKRPASETAITRPYANKGDSDSKRLSMRFGRKKSITKSDASGQHREEEDEGFYFDIERN